MNNYPHPDHWYIWRLLDVINKLILTNQCQICLSLGSTWQFRDLYFKKE